jgi:DNA-binding beta-propeller fold protein YncE
MVTLAIGVNWPGTPALQIRFAAGTNPVAITTNPDASYIYVSNSWLDAIVSYLFSNMAYLNSSRYYIHLHDAWPDADQ